MDEVEKTIHSLAGHRCENCVWADWVEIKRTSLLDEKNMIVQSCKISIGLNFEVKDPSNFYKLPEDGFCSWWNGGEE